MRELSWQRQRVKRVDEWEEMGMGMASDEDEERMGMGMASRCEWHPGTVECLLESYGDKCCNIKGYLKIKDWEDIVRCVNAHCDASKTPKTVKQCRDKVENLKRRYKLEKRRADTRGPGTVTWSFFHQLDHIMANLNKSANLVDASASAEDLRSPSPSHSQSFELNDCDLPEGFAGESMSVPLPAMSMSDMVLSVFGAGAADKGKLDADCSLDDILNSVGYSCKNKARLDFQDSSSPEKKPPKRKKPSPFAGASKKRKSSAKSSSSSSSNPVQSLADALEEVRFDIYCFRSKLIFSTSSATRL
ncbi:hypothetical protein SUGI_0337090 [Cryptomeria japonica]|nr:hypothetical protein SUGI_0337090 [Cryptomeria japonica]